MFRNTKKKVVSLTVVLLFLTLHLTLYTSVTHAQVKSNVTLILVSGVVEVKSAGEPVWKKAEKKMTLGEKDEIRTSPGARGTLLFEDGSKINLQPNTTLTLAEIKENTTVVVMDSGKIDAKVKKVKTGAKFEINTPTSVCAVRGTKFTVEVLEDKRTIVNCYRGLIGVRQITGIGEEVTLHSFEKTEVSHDIPPMAPIAMSKEEKTAFLAPVRNEVNQEVRMDMSREQVQAAAAQEIKLAEYQQGKSIIDAFGYRVRIEEYIVRPQANQFKMVVLNEREKRFDYFTWKATFNNNLPTDLKDATKWIGVSEWASTPDYYLTANESAVSNTTDIMEWNYTGGRIVQSGTKYQQLYDNYVFRLGQSGNMVEKLRWDATNATSYTNRTWYIAGDLANPKTETQFYSWLVQNLTDVSLPVSDNDKYYMRYGLTFPVNKKYSEEYYIIDDEGKLLTVKEFNENWDKLQWNEELVFKADEFVGTDKKIDLVVEPKIFADAGIGIPSD